MRLPDYLRAGTSPGIRCPVEAPRGAAAGKAVQGWSSENLYWTGDIAQRNPEPT